MKRLSIVLLISATLAGTSGCATKKFVRKTVNSSADTLNARIDNNEGEMKEIRDSLDRKVTAVDSKVTNLDSRTTEGLNSLKGDVQGVKTDVQGVDQRTGEARRVADRASNDVGVLGKRFENRNLYNPSDEKMIRFKFDSAKLDQQYMDVLDQVATVLLQNPDAILVLEGRTDSTGNKDYNVRLGERRIEAVKRYLAVEKGVPVFKIHEISFGSEKPLAENKTRDGRETNRAVTMTVMVPKIEGTVASRNDN